MEPLYQELELVSWSSRLNSYSQFLDDAFNNFYNHLLGIRPNYTTWKMPLQELSATKSPFPMKERDRPLCRILLHWMMGESIILQLWISPGTKKWHLLSPLRMLIHRHNSIDLFNQELETKRNKSKTSKNLMMLHGINACESHPC